jgi:hypothetical protein
MPGRSVKSQAGVGHDPRDLSGIGASGVQNEGMTKNHVTRLTICFRGGVDIDRLSKLVG